MQILYDSHNTVLGFLHRIYVVTSAFDYSGLILFCLFCFCMLDNVYIIFVFANLK